MYLFSYIYTDGFVSFNERATDRAKKAEQITLTSLCLAVVTGFALFSVKDFSTLMLFIIVKLIIAIPYSVLLRMDFNCYL